MAVYRNAAFPGEIFQVALDVLHHQILASQFEVVLGGKMYMKW